MTLPNGFVRSATWEGMAAENGAVTEALVTRMVELAQGRVGLIVSGHAYVEARGQASPWQLGIHDDTLIEGHRHMVDAVHRAEGKIAIQLAHAGRRAIETLPLENQRRISHMNASAIKEVVDAFGEAAKRAKAAGYDAIQIHAAHGYFLSQTLSPLENQRKDAYGDSLENRMRLLLEVVRRVQSEVGGGFPLLIKLNSADYVEGGFSQEEAAIVAQNLEKSGIHAIELSGGTPESGELVPIRPRIDTLEKESYFREAALGIKKAVSIPIILVGGIRHLEVAEQMVQEGRADLISMSRPLIREPGLIKRWIEGSTDPALCDSCCRCFVPARKGEGIRCMKIKKNA